MLLERLKEDKGNIMEDSKNITSPSPRLTRRCWLLAGLTLLPFWSIIIYFAVSESGGLPFLVMQGAAVIIGVVNLFFLIYFTLVKPVKREGQETETIKWKPPVNLQSHLNRLIVVLLLLLPFFYLLIFHYKVASDIPLYLIFIMALFIIMPLYDLPKCKWKELKRNYYIIFVTLTVFTAINLYIYISNQLF